jgi:16S rRNA (guanine527-N7)-methyltransferase
MTKEGLLVELKQFGLDNIASFECLLNDTLTTNEKFNLTAITDEEKFRELMILDSLYPLKLLDFNDKKVVDIGTGAGYPGLPLALASNAQFTLLDSTKKKIDHINEYVSTNNITNVIGVVSRAEDYAKKHVEEYDIAISRAVAPLNVLLEIVLPMVKVGGYFIAMKGLKALDEIKLASRAFKELGCVVENIDEFLLPESRERRYNILIKKVKPTNKKYPRLYSEIIHIPL